MKIQVYVQKLVGVHELGARRSLWSNVTCNIMEKFSVIRATAHGLKEAMTAENNIS